MNLLVKMPTRQRPHKALPLLDQYIRYASGEQPMHLVICVHHDDATMRNPEVEQRILDQAARAMQKNITLYMVPHRGKTKVDAYNANPQYDLWDIQVATSDDMVPRLHGYDKIIVELMQEKFPGTNGILHFNDGHRAEQLMSLPIVGRTWYNRFNYVYCPEYVSLYCDNEMMDVARLTGTYYYDERVVIEHCHPAFIGETRDPLLNHTESFYDRDGAVYQARKEAKFYLKDGLLPNAMDLLAAADAAAALPSAPPNRQGVQVRHTTSSRPARVPRREKPKRRR